MIVTTKILENAKPKSKTYRIWDKGSGGLHWEITPNGGKWTRYKYRFKGKANRISLGTFPKVGLKEARLKAAEIQILLDQKIDPSKHRKESNTGANTFEFIAREWHEKHKHLWTESYTKKLLRSFENDVFPWIGKRQIAELDTPDVLSILDRIQGRTLYTAHRVLTNCNRVFRYAKQTARIKYNPCSDMKGALPPVKVENFQQSLAPKKVGELLRVIDGYQNGSWVVQSALRLAPLVFVRPGELRRMEWGKISILIMLNGDISL